MADSSSEIVVGIDFGTTHSGVSWAVNGGTRQIRLVNNWPDPNAQVASPQKVPSTICYHSGKAPTWGYGVNLKDQAFKWVKLLLETEHKYIKDVDPVEKSRELLSKMGKTAQEVVADYLRVLWNYTMEDICNYREDYDPDVYSIRLVLTVPAMWSPAAKERTIQAARNAGMPGNILLVSEPEAAALATLKEKSNEGTLNVGDAFVVCDAGGGTVDLISYEVTGLMPLRLKECAIGSGGLCGSVFIDQAFERYICTLVGRQQWHKIREGSKKRMMQQFEYGIKRSFTESSRQQFSVDLAGVEDDPEHDIYDDTITLTTSGLRGVFDIVLGEIEDLISKQIEAVTEKGLTVKAVLLVGGFGESRYLLERLRHCHAGQGIRVLQTVGAWSAICRGATMWGLEHSELTSLLKMTSILTLKQHTIASRLSRYSYGLCLNEQFNATKHVDAKTYIDPTTGVLMAQSQMFWFLKRGAEIIDGSSKSFDTVRRIQVGFWSSGEMSFQKRILYCDKDQPPTNKNSSVKHFCTVHYKVDVRKLWHAEKSWRSSVDKAKYRNACFKVEMIMGSALEFLIHHKDKLIAQASATYLE